MRSQPAEIVTVHGRHYRAASEVGDRDDKGIHRQRGASLGRPKELPGPHADPGVHRIDLDPLTA